jgi:hypothetical protein
VSIGTDSLTHQERLLVTQQGRRGTDLLHHPNMILIKFALDQPRLRSDILRLHLTMCWDSERLTDLKESNFKRLSERSEERFVLLICGDVEQTGHTSIQEVFDVVPYLREVKKERNSGRDR